MTLNPGKKVGRQVDISNPKNIVIGALALVAAGSAGSMLGITIEPEETTTLRVEKAQLEIQVTSLEEKLASQKEAFNTASKLSSKGRKRELEGQLAAMQARAEKAEQELASCQTR